MLMQTPYRGGPIWPTAVALARSLGLPEPTVGSWKRRGIPASRWQAIVLAARARGHALTLDQMAALEFADLVGPMPSGAVEIAARAKAAP